MKKNGNKSLVFGILGIIFSFLFFGIIFGVLGFIFSIKGLSNTEEKNGKPVVGLVLSVLSFLIFIMMIVFAAFPSGDTTTTQPEAEIEQDYEEPTVDDVEEQAEPEQEIELSVEDYKDECKEYNYKDVLRNPEDFIGEKVTVVVKVSSVHDASFDGIGKYYMAWSDDGSEIYFDDQYGIIDFRSEDDFKILEDDIIRVFGEISEPRETESAILNSEEIFCIDMKYAELIAE